VKSFNGILYCLVEMGIVLVKDLLKSLFPGKVRMILSPCG
jgi:hypothetical protein